MSTELEFIQGYSPLFAQLHKNGKPLVSPLGATAYYVYLITGFPTNFATISKKAKEAMGGNISAGKLIKGRQDLLELGFISKIIPVENNSDFDREVFLPIAPEFVWEDNIEKIKGKISENTVAERFKLVEELQKIYKTNFGKYGVKIESGCITVFHSSQWLLYYLANNIKGNSSIRMLLGTLGSFEMPNIKYYESMLSSGLITKIICDPAVTKKIRIENILSLKEKYPQNIDIRATPFAHGTSRRLIYDNMAIDGKKLLGLNSDLSYISTIYFQEYIIKRMQEYFELTFERSLDLKETINSEDPSLDYKKGPSIFRSKHETPEN